jgi:hypothetical protein
MGAIVQALRTARTLAPRIIASPLQAPNIIRRHLSGQALAALINLIDVSDDITPPAPQFRPATGPQAGAHRGPAGAAGGQQAQYNVMTPGPQMFPAPPAAAYHTMAPAPGLIAPPAASYTSMGRSPFVRKPVSAGPAGLRQIGVGIVNASPVAPPLDTVPLLPMGAGHLATDQSNGVKYVTDPVTRYDKYAVTIHKTILRRNQPLDTREVKDHFVQGKGVGIGIAMFGHNAADHHARFTDLATEWAYKALIWVCVKESGRNEPVFYSHMGKCDRFHHSSFTAGGDVVGAGEWIIKKGHLRKISPNSGHYRPPLDYFHRAVLFMSAAFQLDTTVLLWNTQQDTYEEVPVKTFCRNPSGGGVYKTSPKSP